VLPTSDCGCLEPLIARDWERWHGLRHEQRHNRSLPVDTLRIWLPARHPSAKVGGVLLRFLAPGSATTVVSTEREKLVSSFQKTARFSSVRTCSAGRISRLSSRRVFVSDWPSWVLSLDGHPVCPQINPVRQQSAKSRHHAMVILDTVHPATMPHPRGRRCVS
jgi:hypothetical protein